MSKHYVYVIQCEEFFKVGHAKDPDRRVKDLQIGNPYDLEVIAKLKMPSKIAAQNYESALHNRLKRYHFRGEWFHMNGLELAFKEPRSKRRYVNVTDYDERWNTEG